MSEQETLDEIFGGGKWKGKYQIKWCDLCDTYTIGCTDKTCTGSSCNGHSCDKCHDDHVDFFKAKSDPSRYLNDEERKVCDKIWFLKKYIKDSLEHDEYEINWKRMNEEGKLCELSKQLFKEEIEKAYIKEEFEKTYG